MSNRHRDESGRFADEVTDQAILRLFDATDEAFLTAPEIADEFGVTRQAITNRLGRMESEGLVARKRAGASAVGWWSEVAPRLSKETIEAVEASEGELERGETVPLDEMKRRLGMDGDR